jgi:hypothetical protein
MAVESTRPGPGQQMFPHRPPRKRKRRTLKAAVVLVVVIAIAVILIMPSTQDFLRRSLIMPFQDSTPEWADITFQRTFTVEADGGSLVNFTVGAIQPQTISQEGVDLQQVESFSTDPAPNYTVQHGSAEGLVWEGGEMSGQDRYNITLNYEVKETARSWSLTPSASGTIAQIPSSLKKNYLGDEWKILASDPSIVALSKQINGNDTNVYTILKSTYDWVTANIAYPGSPVPGEPKSSVETLQTRVGDCDDQSNLFLGLIRAAGVPGWLQLGALYDLSSNQMEGHAWVQTYIPYANGGGVDVNIDLVNKDFLEWKPWLFCDYTDNGNANDLRNYYYTFYSVYDPNSYQSGGGPSFNDSFSVLSYSQSPSSVSAGQISFGNDNVPLLAARS